MGVVDCAPTAGRRERPQTLLTPWPSLEALPADGMVLSARRAMKFPGILLAYTPANAPAVVVSAGAVPAAGPTVGTIVSPAANPAVGTVVAPGPAVPTTVAPSPYNSSYPPTTGGVVQGHATQPPPYAAASTGTVVQAEVVAVAPMDRK